MDAFQLIPFDIDPFTDRYHIGGTIQRSRNRLDIVYRVAGPLNGLCIEPMTNQPLRKNRLWEKTCFECFIGTACATRYWEINLSPAGHWNVYRFDNYRRGMQEEPLISLLEITTDTTSDTFQLKCAADLAPIGLIEKPILVALSAVLKSNNGDNTYWALRHPGPQPDFHQREGFVLTIHEEECTGGK